MFTIDPDKCLKDGICAAECPVRIIDATDGIPKPIDTADELCIRCGHCVAVCPAGAFSLDTLTPADCLPVGTVSALTPEAAEQFLRQRRSIRVYRKKPVDPDLIKEVIRIAGFAPSGHNRQPVRWHVIHDPGEVRRLSGFVIDWMRQVMVENPDMAAALNMARVIDGWEFGKDTITRGAPHLVIAHAPKADPTAQAACTIALTYLELALPPFGLGGCWAGFFNAAANLWPQLGKELGLPKGHVSYGSMMLGYPRFTYHRMPLRNPPRITWSNVKDQ